jgi:DNA-binding MarR family transcriptional regulator
VTHGIGGTESHVLHAVSEGMPAEQFGRVSHLPRRQLAAVVDGMRARGLVDDSGRLTETGRQIKQRIEALTDDLAAPAYDSLDHDELHQLIEDLEPPAAVLVAAGSE